jgi:hypothetical protein
MMRGEIKDPVANDIHPSAHSNLLDREELASSTMCGVCHDIHSPLGGHIERTFCEWSHSPFNSSELGGTTCASGGFCHMAENSKMQPIASPQATPQGTVNPPLRFYHAHDFPAVDVPLEPIADAGGTTGDVGEEPDAGDGNSAAVDATVAADAGAANMNASDAANTDRSAAALPATPSYASDAAGAARVQFSLNNAIRGALCVTDRDGIRVVLDPINVGHQWPSGAAQDRRVWAEVIAYKGGKVVYQSGVVPDGTPVGRQTTDTDLADLWLLRDQMLGVDGGPVDMFWQAASAYGNELPAAKSFDTSSPLFVLGHIGKSFPRDGSPIQGGVDRVTLRIRIQPIGLDVLNDLVSSHDLDPTVAAAMPTFDVPIVNRPDSSPPPLLEWTPEAAAPDASSIPVFVDTEDRSDVRCVGAPNFDAVHTGPQTKATCP